MLHAHSSLVNIQDLSGLSVNYLLELLGSSQLSVDVETCNPSCIVKEPLRELVRYAQANGVEELLFSSEGEYLEALLESVTETN